MVAGLIKLLYFPKTIHRMRSCDSHTTYGGCEREVGGMRGGIFKAVLRGFGTFPVIPRQPQFNAPMHEDVELAQGLPEVHMVVHVGSGIKSRSSLPPVLSPKPLP